MPEITKYPAVVSKMAEYDGNKLDSLAAVKPATWLSFEPTEISEAQEELKAAMTSDIATCDAVVLEIKSDILSGINKAYTVRRRLNRISVFGRQCLKLMASQNSVGFQSEIDNKLDGLSKTGVVGGTA